ncbi:MAG: hypothetical protein M0Z49_02400 [Chloroflexi bacterium]|nr:hypothetical protein [Chloroflexota bacterium]
MSTVVGSRMRTAIGLAVTALTTLVAFGLMAILLPPVLWPDRPIPPSLAAYVPAARQQLWSEATDSLRLPLHLTFREARCSPDGSVALIFEEHRPPYTETRFAYALRGSMPTAADDSWDGGAGIAGSVLDDSEFIHQMGSDSTVCGG